MAERDYQGAYDNFSWPRPERFNFARDVVDRWAERDPEKLALRWVDDQAAEARRSFADVSATSCRVANLLRGAGEPLNPEIVETWKRATGITIRLVCQPRRRRHPTSTRAGQGLSRNCPRPSVARSAGSSYASASGR